MGTRKLVVEILGDTKNLGGALDSAGSELGGFASAVGKTALAGGVAFAGLAAAAVPLIGAASDLAETQSKVGVIFGDAADDIEKFASSAAKSLGQSKQQAMDASATFATFGKSAGLAGGDLSKFAIDMTGLASDVASFNNVSPEEAIEAIGSALRGEAEPMRKFGVLLDDAALKSEAMKLGLIKTTKDALSPANKVLAAQAAILSQTKDAQGDFARTSDGLANKQRILAAQLENLKGTIGTALLPIVLKAVGVFGSFADVLSKVLPRGLDALIGGFKNADASIGPSVPKWEAVLLTFGATASKVFGFLAEHVPPILRVLAEVAAEVFGWIGENVPPILDAVAAFIAEKVVPAVQSLIAWVQENLLPALGKLWASFQENILPALETLAVFIATKLLPVLAAIGQWIAEKVLPVVGALAVFILEKAIPAFFELIGFINEKVLPVLGDIAAWFRDLPGNIKGFFVGLSETITAPFRVAFRGIAELWNNTVGKLDFRAPDWVPGIGGKGWSVPDISFHTGGVFRAPNPGGVGLAMLRDGERVVTPGGAGGGSAQPIIVEISGQAILNALVQVDRQNGGLPIRVRA